MRFTLLLGPRFPSHPYAMTARQLRRVGERQAEEDFLWVGTVVGGMPLIGTAGWARPSARARRSP
jgi:hypothetical protein